MNLSRSFFLLSIFILCGFSLSATTKRALLIGIDKYKATKETPAAFAKRGKPGERAGWENLDGCVNDARSLLSIIQARYGFMENNIDTLFNEAATRQGIFDGINKLIATAEKGDVVFIYYAGHGSQVKNSKSYDGTGWDQTIVPADQWDIRNKELSALFNQLVDKGVILTLIFDSCHSGSIARGNSLPVAFKERIAPAADWDANDPAEYPKVEQRGALLFSAAQRSQTAKETEDNDKTPHGAFTLALIRAIAASSASQSADRLFTRILGAIKSEGGPKFQDPILGGTEARRNSGIFGDVVHENASRTFVAVLDVITGEDANVTLRGGHELAIYEGCLLKNAGGTDTLQVIAVNGIGLCQALVRGKGNVANFKPGDLVEMINWIRPDGPTLRIWTPETNFTSEQLKKTIGPAIALMVNYFSAVTDPTETVPEFIIQFNAGKWLVTSATATVTLTALTDATLKAAIPKGKKVFLQLPPTKEMMTSLNKKLGPGTSSSAVEFTKNPLQANYLLAGRMNNGIVEYAFLRPNISEMDSTFRNSLPIRTDWFNSTVTETATDSLAIFAVRLGKISAWLNLESPADNFPYQMVLIRNKTNEILLPGEKLVQGENYHFALMLDSANAPSSMVIVRYCYIFTIDSRGKMSLFYPDVALGAENNVVKYVPYVAKTKVESFVNKGRVDFGIGPPYGYDTYFLVTSDVQLSADVFESDGVITREKAKTGLDAVLANTGSKTRGPVQPVPTHWSVQKFQFRSAGKAAK
ncbi:MAG: caspase family protein [Bacteroidota bacterium]|nr:caspase family protein [Bacteroidota bacterium]